MHWKPGIDLKCIAEPDWRNPIAVGDIVRLKYILGENSGVVTFPYHSYFRHAAATSLHYFTPVIKRKLKVNLP